MELALGEDTVNKNIYNYLGIAYEQIGQNQKAIDIYNQGLDYAGDLKSQFLTNIANNMGILGNYDSAGELSITCKTGESEYKKHFLGLSDNVTYFAEQMESAEISGYHYRVIFRPTTIIPDIEMDIP